MTMPKPAWKEQLDYHKARGWSPVEITPGAGHAVIFKMVGNNKIQKTIFKDGKVKDGYHESLQD